MEFIYDRIINIYDYSHDHDMIEWEDTIISSDYSLDYRIGISSIVSPKKDTKDIKKYLKKEFELIKKHIASNPSTYTIPESEEQ